MVPEILLLLIDFGLLGLDGPGTGVAVDGSSTKKAVPEELWRRWDDVRGGM
jgi:hypothetical protein